MNTSAPATISVSGPLTCSGFVRSATQRRIGSLKVSVRCSAPCRSHAMMLPAPSASNSRMIAAANAIADVVAEDRLNPSYIVPSVFDASVAPAVAAAIRDVTGAASRTKAMHTG